MKKSDLGISQIEYIADISKQKQPLVAIRCITYNHGSYIRDALDGFVMQQTDFSFVAIVHDDASTDNTAAIIREYASRYPDIILPIYETENQYSKHDGSLRRIMNNACAATGAKYIALCEGDDYWTDPLKLQKQVHFLEAHPDYSMCFHNAIVHYEDKIKPNDVLVFANKHKDQIAYQNHLAANLENRDYSVLEFASSWFTPTASVVYRSSCKESEIYNKVQSCKDIYFGDIPLWLTCASLGKVRAFKEVMSAYRIHKSGVSFVVNSVPVPRRLKLYKAYMTIFPSPLNEFYKERIVKEVIFAISVLRKGDYRQSYEIVKLCWKVSPVKCTLELLLYPYTIIKNLVKKGATNLCKWRHNRRNADTGRCF